MYIYIHIYIHIYIYIYIYIYIEYREYPEFWESVFRKKVLCIKIKTLENFRILYNVY